MNDRPMTLTLSAVNAEELRRLAREFSEMTDGELITIFGYEAAFGAGLRYTDQKASPAENL